MDLFIINKVMIKFLLNPLNDVKKKLLVLFYIFIKIKILKINLAKMCFYKN